VSKREDHDSARQCSAAAAFGRRIVCDVQTTTDRLHRNTPDTPQSVVARRQHTHAGQRRAQEDHPRAEVIANEHVSAGLVADHGGKVCRTDQREARGCLGGVPATRLAVAVDITDPVIWRIRPPDPHTGHDLHVTYYSESDNRSFPNCSGNYTEWAKNVPLYFCLYLRQLLTDFQNSFTGARAADNWR